MDEEYKFLVKSKKRKGLTKYFILANLFYELDGDFIDFEIDINVAQHIMKGDSITIGELPEMHPYINFDFECYEGINFETYFQFKKFIVNERSFGPNTLTLHIKLLGNL